MSNILQLGWARVAASVRPAEDFGPFDLQFFDADKTPLDLSDIEFTAQIGAFAALSLASTSLRRIGNVLTFFCAAAARNWPEGRFDFTLSARGSGPDGQIYERNVFVASSFVVGAPVSFEVQVFPPGGGGGFAISPISGKAILSVLDGLSADDRNLLIEILIDAAASFAPALNQSRAANSQYLSLTPFSFIVG